MYNDFVVRDGLISLGGMTFPYTAKTSNYTIGDNDYFIDCTSNSFTVTLPTAVGNTGQIYIIKNSGSGTITVDTTSSQTIDGQSTVTLSQYDSITVESNSSNWSITGSMGIEGPQGYQGSQGSQGSQGNQGSQGEQGSQGSQGQGYQGNQGEQGSQGQGSQGYQGEQGSQGQGYQGEQGEQGSQGQGSQGYQGEQGSQGQGSQGYQGEQGSQGSQGQGSQGYQGAQGSQGSQGQGSQGYQGAQGSQGSQGITGPVAGSANQVVYKDGSNIAAGSSSFTFNGTTVTTPVLAVTAAASTGAPSSSITVTAPAHTSLTKDIEYTDINFNLNRTVQYNTATSFPLQRAFRIQAPTYTFIAGAIITTAVTAQIDSAPVAGSGATLTNAYALRVLTGTTTGVGIAIQGAASQTGDLFRVQNSTPANLFAINNNGSLVLSPYGTSAGQTNEIRFLELAANGTTYVGFKAGDNIPSSVIWTLPTADGTSGQVLSTNASGVLSWITPASKSSGSDIFLANNFGGL